MRTVYKNSLLACVYGALVFGGLSYFFWGTPAIEITGAFFGGFAIMIPPLLYLFITTKTGNL